MISLSDRDGESVYTDNNPEKHYDTSNQDKNIHSRDLLSNKNQFIQDDQNAQWPDLQQDFLCNNDKLEEQNKTFDKLKAEIAQLLGGNTLMQSQPAKKEETDERQKHKPILEQDLSNPSPIDQWELQMKEPIKVEVKTQKPTSIWKYIPRMVTKPKRKQQTEKQQKDEHIQTDNASPSNPHTSQYQQPFLNSDENTQKDSLLLSAEEDSNNAQDNIIQRDQEYGNLNTTRIKKKSFHFPLHHIKKQTQLQTEEETAQQSRQEQLLKMASRQFEGLLLSRKNQSNEHDIPKENQNTTILQTAQDEFERLLHSKQSQQADFEKDRNKIEEVNHFPQPTFQQQQIFSPEDKVLVKQCLREQILELASREFQDLLLSKQINQQEDDVQLSYSQSRNFQHDNNPMQNNMLKSELLTVRDSFSRYQRPSINSQFEQYPTKPTRQSHERYSQESQIMIYDIPKNDEKIKNEEQQLKYQNNKIQILHKIRNLIKKSANKHAQIEKSKHLSNKTVQSSIEKIVVEAESIIDQITQQIKLERPHSSITHPPKQPTHNHRQQLPSTKINDPLSRIQMTKHNKNLTIDPIDISKQEQHEKIDQQRKNQKETLIQHLQAVLSIREESLKELNYVNREINQPRRPKNDIKNIPIQESRLSNKRQRPENSKKYLPDCSARQGPSNQQQPYIRQSETCKCEVM